MVTNGNSMKICFRNRGTDGGEGLALGIAIGVALGAAMDSMGVGIAIGVAIGVALGARQRAQRSKTPLQAKDESREEPRT